MSQSNTKEMKEKETKEKINEKKCDILFIISLY